MSSRKLVVLASILCLFSASLLAGPVEAPPLSVWQFVSAWWSDAVSLFDAIGSQPETLGTWSEIGPQPEPNGSTDEVGPQLEPIGGSDETGPQSEPFGQPYDGTDEMGPQLEPIG